MTAFRPDSGMLKKLLKHLFLHGKHTNFTLDDHEMGDVL
jgi:hypothetical protein